MTKINDYLWHLPHEPLDDDPEDVALLQSAFNAPIVAALAEPLAALGYDLKSNDVVVRLDGRVDNTADTYYANVRFIHYMQSDIITRVHFEHGEWGTILPEHGEHTFFINLDRFRVTDPRTQIAVPAWHGRLHTRISADPESGLHHNGPDQVWHYTTSADLESRLALFLQKFRDAGQRWLEATDSL